MPDLVAPEMALRDDDNEILPDAPADPGSDARDGSGSPTSEAGMVRLEGMFDYDDNEFPTSTTPDMAMETSPDPEVSESSIPAPSHVDTDTMLAFYQRLFPFRYIFQWLNHGIIPSPDFGNREFALTLQNDAYLRYQSYPTPDLFRKDILKMNPSRFEIGPVYSTNPRDRKTLRGGQMKPVSKELVFDIDLTDYDDVRGCCEKTNICRKCWTFVTMAIKVIDTALREDFGFEHILWVYSGRRGAHAWVCDQRARNLSDDRRRAIASYLGVQRVGGQGGKRGGIKRPLHPHLSRSLEILKPFFAQTTLVDQESFYSPEQSDRLLSLLPDKSLNDALCRKWASSPNRSSSNKWADIDALAKMSKNSRLNTTALREAKQDIVFEYTYPRLDSEVSKKMIHLLKSPFVVHPGTGRVCVPVDVRKAEHFDPFSVPTVSTLLAEIDAWDTEHSSKGTGGGNAEGEGNILDDPDIKGGRKLQDYEKTSLRPYIEYFRSFIAGLLKEERSGKRERGDGDAGPATADPIDF